MVLVILLLRECELLDAPSGTALRLFSLHQAALFVVKLRLKVLDLLLQPGGDLPASLHGLLLSFVQLGLHVLHLALQGAAVLLGVLGVLLLCSHQPTEQRQSLPSWPCPQRCESRTASPRDPPAESAIQNRASSLMSGAPGSVGWCQRAAP